MGLEEPSKKAGQIGIVIVAHGGLAKEYLAAVEHVVGKQDGVVAVGASAECDRSVKEAEICAAAAYLGMSFHKNQDRFKRARRVRHAISL